MGSTVRGFSTEAHPCVRWWGFRRIGGHTPRALAEAPALARGILVHTGLEHLYAAIGVVGDPGLVEENQWLTPIAEEAEKLGIDLALMRSCQICVTAYRQMLVDRQERPRVMAVEYPIELWITSAGLVPEPPDAQLRRDTAIEAVSASTTEGRTRAWLRHLEMGPPWYRTTRIDLIERVGPQLAIVDHKTTGTTRWGSKKRVGYALSAQMLGMAAWGAFHWKSQFWGIKVNIVGFDREKLRRELVDLPAVPNAIAGWFRAVDRQERWRLELLQSGEPPTRWPGAFVEQGPCLDRYSVCDYREVCEQ